LGPLFFLIFINDIAKGIVNKLFKFADDTKLVGTVSSECEINQLCSDLKQVYDSSVDWQMLFNTDKCKVLHFGYKNMSNIYSLGINAENEEKDLGVIVSDTLKPRSQCIAAAQSVKTRSSVVAKRPRDASCRCSFNTKRRAQSFSISCFGFRYITAYN